MRHLPPVLAALAVALALAVVAERVVAARTGPLALVGIVEVHLLVVATVLAVIAIAGSLPAGRARARTRLAGLVVVVLAVVALGGELWSPAPATASAGSSRLGVLSWNLELGSKAAEDSVAGIRAMDADVVGLQELAPDGAAAIEADPVLRHRYPYRILEARPGFDGLGLLARRPLLARGRETDPLVLRAGLLLEDGRTLDVLVVHPYPPAISILWGLPVGVDTRRRDEDLSVIAAEAAGVADPSTVLVVGDLNAAATEPGFHVFDGLADAHAAAGTGPGFTWRPSSLEAPGLGLLRIDHVLTGPALLAESAATDCSAAGDHCRLLVTIRVPPRAR